LEGIIIFQIFQDISKEKKPYDTSKIFPRKSDDVSKDKTFIRDTPTYKIHSPEEIKVYDI